MGQDLRKLFEKERSEKKYSMGDGHEDRFLEKLEREIPEGTKKKPFVWISVAASLLILLGFGFYFFSTLGDENQNKDLNTTIVDKDGKNEGNTPISLGDLSPDLKRVEDYYVANINLQLSGLEFSSENKALVDGYMEQLGKLDAEYDALNAELNEFGPNDDTIGALINNLQLRLQLLQKLQTKLNQLKTSKNEQESSISI